MKKRRIMLLLIAAATLAGCGSSAGQTTDASQAATEALPEGSEDLYEYATEDAEPDNWMDYAPVVEETDEEKKYDAVSDQLEQEILELPTGVIIHLNNPSEPGDVQTDINVQFYDASGNETWFSSAEFNSLPVGEDMYVPLEMEDTYDHYTTEILTTQAYMEDITDSAIVDYTENDGTVTAELTNGSDKEAVIATVTTLYYKENQLAGCTIDYAFDILPGNTYPVEITRPTNYQTGEAVEYDRYECLVHTYAESDEMASEMEAEEIGGELLQ